MTPYTTLGGNGEGRYEEKKSVFLGFARPLATEGEALDFIAEIKSAYPDARHHVYAYLLRHDNLTRYSDDREPQGTAGMPVLDLLKKSGCTDAGIVVVRYFGGTLLGTGGLVRAYTAAAKDALSAAGVVTYRPFTECMLAVNYADYQKLLPFFTELSPIVDSTDFATEVTLMLAVDAESFPRFERGLTELTSGRASLLVTGSRFDCGR